MAKEVTFEAQVRRDGNWCTVGVFGDREAATSEAERRLDPRRAPAVRVLQVIFDAASNQCTEYTVFRAPAADEDSGARVNPLGNIELFRRRRRPAAAPAPEPAAPPRDWRIALALGLLCLVGIVASVFHHLQ